MGKSKFVCAILGVSPKRTIIGQIEQGVVGLDSLTGDELWRFATDDYGQMKLLVGFLILTSDNGDRLEFIDPETGQSLSRIDLPSGLFKFGELEIVSDKIVISSREGIAIIKP